ncbi:SpoIIIAH-like family protein [Sporotomaculum syntrophicum]|uniref:SpoIIIAH-like family protein n=1 Tax=Sporotomaculum syntrophicum TaxID=182264 RepID=UPI001FABB63D|nr:SpoIIIAH-like family protein [Sporotomaculum syntrophicum]
MIKLDRKKIFLVFLIVMGIAFCAVGFGGLAQKVIGLQENASAPTTVTLNQSENGEVDAAGDAGQASLNAPENTADGSYFVEARLSLEQARGKEMETLREVLNSETDEDVRKTAQERMMQLSGQVSQEMELENLIRAKGYQDAAVFLDSDTVTVILRPGKNMASETDNSAIAELVAKTTGVAEDGVIVITREN